MLKGIDHRLNAEVLAALRAAGHGDLIVLCDRNFPAATVAATTQIGRPLLMENLTSAEAAAAILSVMPLDTFVDDYAMSMEVVGDAGQRPPVQQEVDACIAKYDGRDRPTLQIERFAFYELAKSAFAIIQTGETRFFGCFVLRKGVVPPEEVVQVTP
ncbi:L-fucose mutarotase [Tritonibacter multivorans]|uniref:L-fucose mutarotase n=1 Tax=Tritonibacter multivorans TaxID=928856 RepID=A0A0P1GWA9_9RHOB|nr:RbsD/FucU domain-containing protein [Tritonibacter multivorans]MDA7419883.1 ribose ABC transporter [Tritonibacter multivorans]CUH79244.1 L-fucose mutarotase [Tritonibacter multivorans]SFC13247.1 L-fucose mutarotase [Tritonibacter multivorans]